MKKSFCFAVEISGGGLCAAYVYSLCEGENLVSFLAKNPNIITLTPISSREKAQKVVDGWNDGYKARGVYLYD